MFQIVFLSAHSAGRFSSRHRLGVSKEVALGSRMTPLLKVSKVLHNKPLLLIRNRPVARLPHQVQHTFTIFILAAVLLRQMAMKVGLRDEVRVAKLADNWWSQNGLL